MIIEDYVSFETAKLLKEKGFDEECFQYWHEEDNELVHSLSMHPIQNISNPCFFGPAAPTLQMAMKWLREVHNKHCHVSLDYVLGWYIQIVDTKETAHIYDDEEMKIYHPEQDYGFNSYEQACEAAIKYCLENLI